MKRDGLPFSASSIYIKLSKIFSIRKIARLIGEKVLREKVLYMAKKKRLVV